MPRRKLLILTVFIAVLVIFFYKGAASAHTPSPSICNDATCNIDIQNDYFDPKDVTIRPPNPTTGEKVTVSWFNHGSLLHSVTSGTPAGTPDGIIDQDVAPGTFFNLTITQSLYDQIIAKYPDGTLPYYCKYHYSFGMTATLTISGTPIPEFSLLTLSLTIAATSVLLLTILRSRKHI